ncbi:glycosyltransferase family 4 protein [Kitasatospora sp. NPDC057965]|uniref:glycosyltransferase family 4 protein n=1 Tax=Kitasatospora sp. NPDC057965 TaxID=3346291 RepID=UPI0036D7A1B6
MPDQLRVDTGCLFFPRGGSAYVINYLNRELDARGHSTRQFVGSLGQPGDLGHARTFYCGLTPYPYDYNDAYALWKNGENPQGRETDRPFHPSYEDRSMPGVGCPDPMFSAVPDAAAEHLTDAWEKHLAQPRPNGPAHLLHLHHLSHLQVAAARAHPHLPRVTTLHGTELKIIAGMRDRLDLAMCLGRKPSELAAELPTGRPDRAAAVDALALEWKLDDDEHRLLAATDWTLWEHSLPWLLRMRHASTLAGSIVTVSEHDRDLARQLLPDLADGDIPVIANGVATDLFTPGARTDEQRLDNLRRWLVTDPRGWDRSGEPGSIRYTEQDLARFTDPTTGKLRPIVLWTGRFLAFKRVPVMLEAFARALPRLDPAPVLLMWGGVPGECEGAHPADLVRDLGIANSVFFAGYRGHDDLPEGLRTAALMAAPAVNEPFGMVYIEAMAAGCPPIATSTGGPARIITPAGDRANGWLVQPDSADTLTAALVHALTHPEELARRAANAAMHARLVYGWEHVADRYTDVYRQAIDAPPTP